MTTPDLKDELLLAYAAGELAPEDVSRVENAIRSNPQASSLVALYRSVQQTVVEDDSVAPPAEVITRTKALFDRAPRQSRVSKWLEAVDRVIATLIFDSRTTPAMAGFRGAAQAIRLSFESEKGEIDLELTPSTKTSGETVWRMMGQVAPTGDAEATEVVLTAPNSETVLVEASVEAGGIFELETSLPDGVFDMHIRIGPDVITLRGIDVG